MKKFKTKNELAIEMIEQALNKGFPECTVLADARFGAGPFIKALQRLNLIYILEAEQNLNVKEKCKTPKLTETGRIAKNQYDLTRLPKFFEPITSVVKYGFAPDEKAGLSLRVAFIVKSATLRFNSIPG